MGLLGATRCGRASDVLRPRFQHVPLPLGTCCGQMRDMLQITMLVISCLYSIGKKETYVAENVGNRAAHVEI